LTQRAKWASTLSTIALIWLLVASILVVSFWPVLPRSTYWWAIFLLVGPPIYVSIEGFFTWLLSEKHGQAISRKPFSMARITVALAFMLVTMGFLFGLLPWLLSKL
jgi:hypothetical protein